MAKAANTDDVKPTVKNPYPERPLEKALDPNQDPTVSTVTVDPTAPVVLAYPQPAVDPETGQFINPT